MTTAVTFSKLRLFMPRSNSNARCVSSFLSKKKMEVINEAKRRATKRIKRLDPDHDKDVETFVFGRAGKNPLSRVYTWGNACHGALGSPELLNPDKKEKVVQYTMPRPHRYFTLL